MNLDKIHLKSEIPKLFDICHEWEKAMGYDVTKAAIEAHLEHIFNKGVLLYAETEGRIVGLMTGDVSHPFWVSKPIAHENWLFVSPTVRSRGIGGLLITAFEAWAKSVGCGSVIVTPNKFGSSVPENASSKLSKNGYDVFGFIMRKEI